ncbi:hypothetical protein [Burkholderia alba]|uniref:hypothetical protein n=1 Tax=Burkholderia alba TaxID=2683677 RepID=UPI002B060DAC|nr:hypothetical protein [Burkholderia alba]
MHPKPHRRPGRQIPARAHVAALAAALALLGPAPARAQPSGAPPTCEAEAAAIDAALQRARVPGLCARCAERLARTLASLYATGTLPTFYLSADHASWDDPQRRPAMLSGHSLANLPDGPDLLADIDSGYGPRGIHRLRYTRTNRPLAVTTADRAVSIPVSACTARGSQ